MWVSSAHSSRSAIRKILLVLSKASLIADISPYNIPCRPTYTVIFAVDVFQIIAILALAVIAAKGVHTLSIVWTEVLPGYAFINI